jgi:3-phenylpropionate/trans-cinnamate dioxygenase ferredoxin reductase subunit
MSEHYDVLIVGGGHGGAQAAMALRQNGFAGTMAIVGAEPDPPYDRPPLSKEYLAGEKAWDRLVMRSADYWAERRIDLILSTRVTAIDARGRAVETDRGRSFAYSKLIWAAGGTPLRLSGAARDVRGVHTLRCRADADRMIAQLPDAREVAVVGGGYIGLEAAAVLTRLGKKVTLLEAQDRVLARVAAEPLARFYEAQHRAHGVDVRLNVAVEAIVEEAGQATGVRLADGAMIPAQMIIVGIGIAAAAGPLIAAGAESGNGVRVDGQCRTSLPDVYAIGDCAEHRNGFAGDEWVRLESVQNATDQATIAAKSICGGAETYAAVPWFWSNQYDLRLQTVGLSRGFDELVVRGDPDRGSFSLVYLRGGIVIALDCVNATRDFVQGRALVVNRVKANSAVLADISVPLKSLAPAAPPRPA